MVDDGKIRPMIKFIKKTGLKQLVGAEVGVWYGDNALSILENLDIACLTLVDPYKRHKIYNGRLFRQKKMDMIIKLCKEKLVDYKKQYVLFRMPSVKGARMIADGSLDFVYIDGQHMYKHIRKDIKAWYPKVREGGFIGGHDYNSATEGVIRAVNELRDKTQKKLYTSALDWWIVKP